METVTHTATCSKGTTPTHVVEPNAYIQIVESNFKVHLLNILYVTLYRSL